METLDDSPIFVDTNILVYANIVATMLTAGVDRLLTHNVGDFDRFSGLITVIPLVATA